MNNTSVFISDLFVFYKQPFLTSHYVQCNNGDYNNTIFSHVCVFMQSATGRSFFVIIIILKLSMIIIIILPFIMFAFFWIQQTMKMKITNRRIPDSEREE